MVDVIAQDQPEWKELLMHAQNFRIDAVILPEDQRKWSKGGRTGWDLSMDLWNVLILRLGPELYRKRFQLGAHDGNGFELWHALFRDYQGGDELVQNAGRLALQSFPPCKHRSELAKALDTWMELYDKFGSGWGLPYARTSFMGILPPSSFFCSNHYHFITKIDVL